MAVPGRHHRPVLRARGREVAGAGPAMPTQLVLDALRAALGSRKPSELGVISTRTEASQEFRQALAGRGLSRSSSRAELFGTS